MMFPKARVDALTDGVFAVAMTLLVLDVRLPEDFHAHDARGLVQALAGLVPKFWPYVLSFLVLGYRWLSHVQVHSRGEFFGREYVTWWLIYLLLITCVPFTTMILGRYGDLAPAIWLYAGNAILIALVAFRLMALAPEIERDPQLRARKAGLLILIASSLFAVGLTFVWPDQAFWGFFLNFAGPLVAHRKGKPSLGPRVEQ